MIRDRSVSGIMLALGSLVLLGIMPVVSNSRPADVDALVFAFCLSIWQVVFAIPLFAWELRGSDRGVFEAGAVAGSLPRFLVLAVVTGAMFGLSTYLYVLGVEKAGATSAAIAIQAYPLFAILWESLFLGRRKSLLELFLTGILIAALYYLGTGGTWRMSGLSPWFLVALCVPLIWSVAHVIIREELVRTAVTPAQVTLFRVAISTVFLAALLAVVAPQRLSSDSLQVLWSSHALAMGLVYYLELIVWFYAVRHIDVSLASTITTPWPVLTMVLAAVFLGDPIEGFQVAVLAVVVVCIYGLTWASLAKRRASAKQ